MAWGRKKTYNRKRKTTSRRKSYSKKQSRSKTLTTLAYNMGQVEKGLKNPDSRISASFKAGENQQKREKKSLF